MTEAEWLACTDPYKKLCRFRIRSRRMNDARKLRLYGVACCRRIWQTIPDPRSRNAVEVAERYADGAATDNELRAACKTAAHAHAASFHAKGKVLACPEWAAEFVADPRPFIAATQAGHFARIAAGDSVLAGAEHQARYS
jgi:hypothetical protein